jgi:hypothetical protein
LIQFSGTWVEAIYKNSSKRIKFNPNLVLYHGGSNGVLLFCSNAILENFKVLPPKIYIFVLKQYFNIKNYSNNS